MNEDYLGSLSVLYVEDDELVREGYTKALRRYAKELFIAKDGLEGLALYKTHMPDLVITDIKMPRLNGLEMARAIKELAPSQIVFFTTAHTDSEYTLEALELQADAYLLKPVDKEKLKAKIALISKQVYLEKKHSKELKIVQQILDNQTGMTILSDLYGISYASRSFLEFFDLPNVEAFTKRYTSLLDLFVHHNDYVYGFDKQSFLESYESCQKKEQIVSMVGVDGPKAFIITLDEIKDCDEVLFIIMLTDITSFQKERLKVIHQVHHDTLTSIYNRRYLEELMQEFFETFSHKNRTLCIAIMDIDHFKVCNDTFGHIVGDEVLKMLASHVRQSIRKNDEFIRWGGEEFVLLMMDTTLDMATQKAENLCQSIASLQHSKAGSVHVSIGVTQCLDSDDYNTLFKRCDEALYCAKKDGRNRVVAL